MKTLTGKHGGYNGERGVALVTALLVVALASVAAVGMATRLHVDMRRSANLLHGEQAYAYAIAAESWAQVILKRDADNNNTDSEHDDWATALPPIAVEGGLVDGLVEDLQGRFNLNNLVDKSGAVNTPALDFFKRLLENLKLDPEIATALVDWIDADINETLPGGAEDGTYLLAVPPYRAANRPLVDISELRLVQGYTPEVITALAPHVTALPDDTQININTATPEVLLALHPALDGARVDSLIAEREGQAYATVNDFLAEPAFSGGVTPAMVLSVDSTWFQVLTDVIVGSGRARLKSLLYRDKSVTRVVWRARARHYLLPP
jgi:general secretion pathway protein K